MKDNFRAIALSSIMGKLLDWIILSKEKAALYTSDQQFGFKHGLSTTQCTNILQETISYYNFHGSSVHVLLLDATKAFGRGKFCKLFYELIRRELSPVILRLLLKMYTCQSLKVKWKQSFSGEFSAKKWRKTRGRLSHWKPLYWCIRICR